MTEQEATAYAEALDAACDFMLAIRPQSEAAGPWSFTATQLADAFHSFAERVCKQRVSAAVREERERCEREVIDESRHWPADNNPQSAFVNILKRIRAPAERPAPEPHDYHGLVCKKCGQTYSMRAPTWCPDDPPGAPEVDLARHRSSTTTLLPCPFCGGEAQFRQALWPSEGDTDAVIHVGPTECPLGQFDDGSTDLSIIAKWNHRPPSGAGGLSSTSDGKEEIQQRVGLNQCSAAVPLRCPTATLPPAAVDYTERARKIAAEIDVEHDDTMQD